MGKKQSLVVANVQWVKLLLLISKMEDESIELKSVSSTFIYKIIMIRITTTYT